MSYHSELDIQIKESQKYNGWTNYATWRINLEIFDGAQVSDFFYGQEIDHPTDMIESLKMYAEDIIFNDCGEGLARDYAFAFINEVNWYEIAEHFFDQIEGEAQLQEDYDENTN